MKVDLPLHRVAIAPLRPVFSSPGGAPAAVSEGAAKIERKKGNMSSSYVECCGEYELSLGCIHSLSALIG